MILKNATVVMERELLPQTDLQIQEGIITKIGKISTESEECIDLTGHYVCPGFLDLHTHGGFGGDFMDATHESFDKALMFHASQGTTAVLPTSVTAPVDAIDNMISMAKEYRDQPHKGSRVLGVHLEGPYLSVAKKGAQKQEYLREPQRDGFDFLLKHMDICKRITLAPELPGSEEMIRVLVKCGVQVSGGHDDAQEMQIRPALEAGMSSCTHWYCAMSSVAMRNLVRSVGLVELGLLDDRLILELLADNHHLPPELVQLAYRCKGADGLCLVSDSLRAAGMPQDGTLYSLGLKTDENAQKFRVANGVAVMEDGTHYAGSIQSVSQMVRNLIVDCGIPIVDTIKMATLTPAKLIGVDHIFGQIAVGRVADLCVLDSDFCVRSTFIGGKEI